MNYLGLIGFRNLESPNYIQREVEPEENSLPSDDEFDALVLPLAQMSDSEVESPFMRSFFDGREEVILQRYCEVKSSPEYIVDPVTYVVKKIEERQRHHLRFPDDEVINRLREELNIREDR